MKLIRHLRHQIFRMIFLQYLLEVGEGGLVLYGLCHPCKLMLSGSKESFHSVNT